VAHEKGGKFCINAAIRPGFWNPDDTGGVFPKEWAEVFDVFGENEAVLRDSKLIDLWIREAGEIEIVLDVFDIKALIQIREILAG